MLARFVVEADLDRAPAEIRPRLRDLFLDHIAVAAFAAIRAESSPAVKAAVDALDPGEGPATAIGMTRGYSWSYAALLNGVHAHSLDMDDTNRVQTGHPGVAIFPAAMAEAERLDSTGQAFLDAVAVGYEVCCRVGAALTARSYERGFHITAASGIFGAVAVVARLRGFDAATTSSAFGLALSKAAGTMQYLADGAWNKRLHPGFLAQDALLLRLMGSPDPLQIDGLGGSRPITSKLAIISRSARADYTFGQVEIQRAAVVYSGNCGNISAGVGPFAIDEGLVEAAEGITSVRIHNTNTGTVMTAHVPVRAGRARVEGGLAIPGCRAGARRSSWTGRGRSGRRRDGCCRPETRSTTSSTSPRSPPGAPSRWPTRRTENGVTSSAACSASRAR
ncbi:hypothetical protein GCM10010191_60130 [Actinomadura vinacea]|uniref:MmgE/PrpD N-terminal domain-containing protein n=1 Tax=Actinomadura vinacea TaxID=115336 RepID=A0ABN3JQ90_9ACTN